MNSPNAPAIAARSLTKRFRPELPPAVDALGFEIAAGESVAFLGPNGAGKSTTIKLLCGILLPDSGTAAILGSPAGSRDANRALGLVFGARSQLYFHMTVKECLGLQAETYFVTREEARLRIPKLAEIFGATKLLSRRVRELSLGERMRCELVTSLVHKPRVILLDEPTIGLDVVAKLQLRESLRQWRREENTTLLLTSHDLSDVEALCDRCILINHGRKAFDGKLSDARRAFGDRRKLNLTLSEPIPADLFVPPTLFRKPARNEFEVSLEFDPKDIALTEVFAWASSTFGSRLADVQMGPIELEEVIRKHYEAPQ
jgi:ABC-2 type transport system ATP-binding protein